MHLMKGAHQGSGSGHCYFSETSLSLPSRTTDKHVEACEVHEENTKVKFSSKWRCLSYQRKRYLCSQLGQLETLVSLTLNYPLFLKLCLVSSFQIVIFMKYTSAIIYHLFICASYISCPFYFNSIN